MSDAEEALAALARDLVEEIAAGRALELAGGWGDGGPEPGDLELADHQRDILELVSYVRPFQRRSPSGTHMEQVRGYQEQRKPGLGQVPGQQMEHPGNLRTIAGAPPTTTRGYIPEADWLKGEQEWKAKGEAAWKKHEWKGGKKPKTTQDVFSGIRDTRKQSPGAAAEAAQDRGQSAAWRKVDAHLDHAQEHLNARGLHAWPDWPGQDGAGLPFTGPGA